jgi:hypothetical protein
MSWHQVAVVQYTFSNKQNTEYRERNIHKNKKLNTHNHKNINSFGKCGPCASLRVIPWHLPYNWGKRMEKPQYITSRHRTMKSTKHGRKTVTQSSTMSQNNKEHRIHNRENSPYQVSKSYLSGRNKSWWKSRNPFYRSIKYLLFCTFLLKNIKIKV